MKRSAALALLISTACAPGVLKVELPPEVSSAAAAIIAVTDQTSLRSIDALDPKNISADALPEIVAWQGELLNIFVLTYDQPLLDLQLRSGPLTTTPGGLSLSQLPRRAILELQATKEGAGAWLAADQLPALIGEFRVPLQEQSRCDGVIVEAVNPPGPDFLDFDHAALTGDNFALVAGSRIDRNAVIGTVPRVGEVQVQELDPSTDRITGLAWDGLVTTFAVMRLDAGEQAIVLQLDERGTIQLQSALPAAADEYYRLASGPDQPVLAYSGRHTFQLAAGSTRTLDRTADFPAGMIALALIASDRIAAATIDGNLHYFDGRTWEIQDYERPRDVIANIHGDREVLVALTYSEIILRNESTGRWSILNAPFQTLPKLAAAGIGQGDFLFAGGRGAMGIYDGSKSTWCTINTGALRYFRQILLTKDGRTAFTLDDQSTTEVLENSIFYWVTHPTTFF